MIQSYKDLQVFRLSYELAMEVFRYITSDECQTMTGRFEELGKMLYRLLENWKTYTVEKGS